MHQKLSLYKNISEIILSFLFRNMSYCCCWLLARAEKKLLLKKITLNSKTVDYSKTNQLFYVIHTFGIEFVTYSNNSQVL